MLDNTSLRPRAVCSSDINEANGLSIMRSVTSPLSSNLNKLFSLTVVVVSDEAAMPTIETMLIIVMIMVHAISPTIEAKVYFRKSFIIPMFIYVID